GLDQDEFIDDIPFPETQNYVKRILGTAEDYRMLYGKGGGRPIPVTGEDAAPAPVVAAPVAKAPAVKAPASTVAPAKKAPALAKKAPETKAPAKKTPSKTAKKKPAAKRG
ncbi:MAG: hypothetical protein ABI211_13500, partial [Vicinamibacterales bacterium]